MVFQQTGGTVSVACARIRTETFGVQVQFTGHVCAVQSCHEAQYMWSTSPLSSLKWMSGGVIVISCYSMVLWDM